MSEKRRVMMRSIRFGSDGAALIEEACDYVPLDILDIYVADAQTRWQSVAVSEEADAGPGGVNGATCIPANLDHPNAGAAYTDMGA